MYITRSQGINKTMFECVIPLLETNIARDKQQSEKVIE